MKRFVVLLLFAGFAVGASAASGHRAPAPSPFRVDASSGKVWSSYGGYLERMIGSIRAKWTVVDGSVTPTTTGTYVIGLVLRADGQISLRVDGVGSELQKAATEAIIASAPFEPWTPEMVRDLGTEQTITLRFYRRAPTAGTVVP